MSTEYERQQTRHAWIALGLALGLLFCALADVETAFAYVAPAGLLLLLLIGGWYPGERAAVRAIVRSRRRRRLRRRATVRRRPLTFIRLTPRGGSLLGAALAGRAPPAPPS